MAWGLKFEMVDELEWLAEECDNVLDTFVVSVASKLQALADKIETYNLEPVFLRSQVGFYEGCLGETTYNLSKAGIFGYNGPMMEEHKHTFRTFAKEYVRDNGAKATVELLKKTEERINRKIMQKQSKGLQDNPDYFADWFVKNTDVIWG